MEESLPPGFRFHPTDEELITHYLDRKISDFTFTSKAIVDVDLNKCEPWDLPAKASMGEKEWYFFSMRDRKYPTGLRTNRATEAGYWKTTGKDKEIFRGRVLVGMKKTLVFYRGRAPKGEKTNWVMHEYRLETNLSYKSNKEEWVVCRVFQKSSIKKAQQCSPQTSMGSPEDTNMTVNEFNDIEVPYTNLLSSSPSDFIHNIMSTQGYSTETNISNHLNNQLNSSTTMNWPTRSAPGSLPSLLSWASSLLSPTLHNTLLEKALQLRGYEVKDALATVINNDDASSFFPVTNLGISGPSTSNHPHQVDSTNLQAPSTSNVSMEIESISSSQQQHQHQQMRTEQPFDLDSLW